MVKTVTAHKQTIMLLVFTVVTATCSENYFQAEPLQAPDAPNKAF
jgi:hypothetical protein